MVSSWVFHRPLVQSRKPVIITWFCFHISTSNLVKMVTQLSSQIFPVEMREPLVMSLKTWVNCALEEIFFGSFKVARKSSLMIFPLAAWCSGLDRITLMIVDQGVWVPVVFSTGHWCGHASR